MLMRNWIRQDNVCRSFHHCLTSRILNDCCYTISEETAEDIRAHMEAIRSDDAHHQRELTSFLDLEMNFAQQYLDVLKDVRSDWSQE
jgi:hypothetical protein